MSNEAGKSHGRLSLLSRIIGTMLFHSQTLEEIKTNSSATTQAVVVVVIAASAIGFGVAPGFNIPVWFVIWWSSWWAVWVFMLYLAAPILSSSVRTEVDWSQVARSMGFAQAPAILMAIITFTTWLGPGVSLTVFSAIGLWWFATMTITIKHILSIRSGLRPILIASTFLIPSLLMDLSLF